MSNSGYCKQNGDLRLAYEPSSQALNPLRCALWEDDACQKEQAQRQRRVILRNLGFRRSLDRSAQTGIYQLLLHSYQMLAER